MEKVNEVDIENIGEKEKAKVQKRRYIYCHLILIL